MAEQQPAPVTKTPENGAWTSGMLDIANDVSETESDMCSGLLLQSHTLDLPRSLQPVGALIGYCLPCKLSSLGSTTVLEFC
jgi:hypothetical protein